MALARFKSVLTADAFLWVVRTKLDIIRCGGGIQDAENQHAEIQHAGSSSSKFMHHRCYILEDKGFPGLHDVHTLSPSFPKAMLEPFAYGSSH